MQTRLNVDICPQPDETTCGPTCLHAVYGYYGDGIPLREVIDEVPALQGGGTLGVTLAIHALKRGYRARIYTYNLHVHDPTWFHAGVDLCARLRQQAELREDPKLRWASGQYAAFLELGGELRYEDLGRALVRKHLRRGEPILTGLSSTYLYRTMRVHGPADRDDDLRGEPQGHFVLLTGYDQEARTVAVADPYYRNPHQRLFYDIHIDRVIGAVLLGIVTYDANLVIICPSGGPKS
jgi:hypothetical protein